MNIIQLFTVLDLKRDQILQFDSNDFIRIEKKINFEKKTNSEIDSNAGEKLIFALKQHKEELLFVLSNRVLFNFFTHSNLSKNHFSSYNGFVSDEKIKPFISLFLADDLISFFSFKLSKNTNDDLEELDFLLDLKEYFPEDILLKMSSLVFSKLDFAISQMAVGSNDFSNIDYIKFRSFYDLLSHFRAVETDNKIRKLLSLVVEYYTKKDNLEFFTSVIQSMAYYTYYTAFDENINETLASNRTAVTVFTGDIDDTKPIATASILIGLFCAVIPFLVTKCS
jgi:hypothetical protein